MNKREKEFFQLSLDAEEDILHELENQYQESLNQINEKIRLLQSNELTQSKIYQLEYQKALKGQLEGIIEKMHGDQYTTLQEYLSNSYTDAFIGTMYNIAGQGIPLMIPIDQAAAVKAIITDSKISKGLYASLGVDANKLKKAIRQEITRGISTAMTFEDIARNISNVSKAPLSRAKTIARTEGHRIQQASTMDAQTAAKSRGADVVKQWDSTLDGRTRSTHRQLDGQIREVEEPFELGRKKAMYPGDFGDPAEDCNCRCASLTRAKWALDEDELQTLKDRAKFFGLDKTDSFNDYKNKYLQAVKEESKRMYDDTAISPFVKTTGYRNLFNNLPESTEVQRKACESAREMLKHRDGTRYEDLTFIDSVTGKSLTRSDYEVEHEVLPSRQMRSMVLNSDPHTIIAIHNHPGSTVPSITDLTTAFEKKYKYGLIACHNGTLMQYEVTGEFNHIIVNSLLDEAQISIYNNDVKELAEVLRQLETENVILGVFK